VSVTEYAVPTTPFGKEVVVTASVEEVILMVRFCEAAVLFAESVTLKTYGPKLPATVGVPTKTPALLRVTPPGIAPPEVCDQV
jgi:hypothetical protein